MRAMILSAGLGTRLRPITHKWTKPAVPFLNVPLLYYPMGLLEAIGTREFVVNLHHKPEQVQDLLQNKPGHKVQTVVSLENAEPLESGGGVAFAQPHLAGESSFWICNGDEVIFPSSLDILTHLHERHIKEQNFATILVMKHPGVGTQFGGVWVDSQGLVQGFGKQAPAAGLSGYHYIGILLVHADIFKYLPPAGQKSNLLYDGVTAAIRDRRRVCIVEDNCLWFETGNPHDYLNAHGQCLQSDCITKNAFMHSFLNSYWAAGTQIKNSQLWGPGVQLEATATVSGFAALAPQSQIPAGCVLENIVMLPDCQLQPHTTHKEAVLI